jgi:hypothetical protein
MRPFHSFCFIASLGCTTTAGGPAPVPQTVPVTVDEPDGDGPEAQPPAKSGACVLATDAWAAANPDEGTPLRLQGDEQPFVVAHQGNAELKLVGGGDPNAVPLKISRHGVTLNATFRVGDVALRLRRPVVFEGIAVPRPATNLAWGGFSAAGKPILVHALREGVEADKLRAEVKCDDITIQSAVYDASEGLLTPSSGRWGRLILDTRVPLAVEARGHAVAVLQGDDAYDTVVREVAFEAGYSRIVWLRQREVVFGWIPGHALMFPETPTELSEEPPYVPEPPVPTGTTSCPKDVELFAAYNGRPPRRAGTIAAGTPFEIGGMGVDHFNEIHALIAFEQAFLVWGDTVFMARTADVAGCQPP